MRHLSSSGVDVFTAIAGAAGALYGPRHGGANEAVLRMLQKIGTVDAIPAFIEKVKSKQVRLMGFGHRVYKNYDPRAKIIRKVAEEVFSILGQRNSAQTTAGTWDHATRSLTLLVTCVLLLFFQARSL